MRVVPLSVVHNGAAISTAMYELRIRGVPAIQIPVEVGGGRRQLWDVQLVRLWLGGECFILTLTPHGATSPSQAIVLDLHECAFEALPGVAELTPRAVWFLRRVPNVFLMLFRRAARLAT